VLDHFEPEEYRQLMAEVQYQVVFRDQPRRIPMYLVWILRDFRIDKYKGWNSKGLVTAGGLRKDAFYLFQAFLRPELPVVHITSKTYFLRRGDPENGIRVYSNLPRLELFLNGESQGVRENGAFAHGEGRRIHNVVHWRPHLRTGRSQVRVTDGAGHEDTAIVHYSPPGAPPTASPAGAPIAELRSSNRKSPAFFIDAPAQEQWPFYYELDGSADNSFDALPPELRGAAWISTPRLSKPGHATALSFRLTGDADVFVVTGPDGRLPIALRAAGFADLGWKGEWRGDDMQLTACRAFRLPARAGDVLRLPRMAEDAVVLVRTDPPPSAR
jgi:beta-galactosidase